MMKEVLLHLPFKIRWNILVLGGMREFLEGLRDDGKRRQLLPNWSPLYLVKPLDVVLGFCLGVIFVCPFCILSFIPNKSSVSIKNV